MSETRAIILAAGRGTRLKSDTTKVLHHVCGRPVLSYVLDCVRSLKTYVVVGFGAKDVERIFGNQVEYIFQDKLLGTGDAVRRVQGALKNYAGDVLVLCGDTPLLEPSTVKALLKMHQKSKASATILSATVDNPHGYGRIIRNQTGQVIAIREQKDLGLNEKGICEINVGAYGFKAKDLFEALKRLSLNAKKQEYYLTDVIAILLAAKKKVSTLVSQDQNVAFGINTRQDLAQAERILKNRILDQLMTSGVSIVDPATTYVEPGAKIGRDTIIYPCSVIAGDVTIGRHCKIGPFARIRPGTRIKDNSEIGNYTEVSRTTIGSHVMMKHFSFLGDTTVGANVNIGAGVVTANYDGKNKNRTMIADSAFIGSDAILVAPVNIGRSAIVGAGSVVPKNMAVKSKSVVMGVPARLFKDKA